MDHVKYVNACDAEFVRRLKCVSTPLTEENIRLICLSGPTCSGKTTAARMLSEELCGGGGRRVHTVSIDDFYYDREYLHKLSEEKGNGEIDYDSEDTVDLGLLEAVVDRLLGGNEAECPVFDFSTGNRCGFRKIKADKNDVFIFEGIQAIYRGVTDILSPYGGVGIYICPMTDITEGEQTFTPNDIRLLRRLVRDSRFRNTDADFTLTLWKSVRANEEKNIFPYVESCKYKIDSTHAYEIGVLRPFLDGILPSVPSDSENVKVAESILQRISHVSAIDSSLISDGSLYREFV